MNLNRSPLLVGITVLMTATPAFAAAPTVTELWMVHDPEALHVPESCVLDPIEEVVYVSNGIKGEGRITSVSLDGEIIEAEWLPGLHEPLGVTLRNRTLYVSDYGGLHVVEIAKRDGDTMTPGTNRCIVGDVALDEHGAAHAVVYFKGRTSACCLIDSEFVEVFEITQMENPNGILAIDGRLLISGAGVIASCNPDGSDWRTIYGNTDIQQFDGLEPDERGGYFATSFFGGELMHIDANGHGAVLGTYESPMDLVYDEASSRLYMPAKKGEEGVLMCLQVKWPAQSGE